MWHGYNGADPVAASIRCSNAADYPWLILVPRRVDSSEIADLDDDGARLMPEIALASRVLEDMTQCDKINVAAIGNVVPQLHVHVVARRKDDPRWPKPVRRAAPACVGDEVKFERFVTAIRDKLGLAAIG